LTFEIGPIAENAGSMTVEIHPLASVADADSVLAAVRERFELASAGAHERVLDYFDTFDWSLYRKKRCLVREGTELRLEPLDGQRILARAALPPSGMIRFACDLGPGPLRSCLDDLAGVRALLHLVTVRIDERRWRLLNEDAKTVVHLAAGDLSLDRGEQRIAVLTGMVLRPMRGYDAEADRVRSLLADAGAGAPVRRLLPPSLAAAGIEPCSYSGKVAVELDADLSAREATCRVLRHLLDTVRANESGVRRDVDTEFLHDFRVAMRRTRVALATLKQVFPPEVVGAFKRDFKAIGKITGPVRDLDVYLLREEEYAEFLPYDLRPGLDLLFADLRRRRTAAQEELVAYLESDTYRETMEHWESFLAPEQQRGLALSRRATWTAAELSRWAIGRRYRRMLRRGVAIGPDSPDSELHNLRIDGKKLRYLLEFFATILPATARKRLVGQLKRLQDNLGLFNDLVVQIADLHAMLRDAPMVEGGRDGDVSAAAIGGLLVRLHERKQEVRAEYAASFASFAAAQTTELIAALGVET
jgi:CHAD domain-containing protein